MCYIYGFSQDSYFGGGFSVGSTFSGMSADNISGHWKTGVTAGLFAHVKVVDKPSIRLLVQMDMNFSMKGTRTKPDFQATGLARKDKVSLSLGYIEFPILLRLRFNSLKANNEGLWLDFGPTIGFMLYQNHVVHQHINTGSGTGSWGSTDDGVYNFTKYDFSLLGGLTYVFKRHHGLSLRYSHSILPIGTPTWEVKNGMFKQHYNSTLYLMYSFQF